MALSVCFCVSMSVNICLFCSADLCLTNLVWIRAEKLHHNSTEKANASIVESKIEWSEIQYPPFNIISMKIKATL